MAQGGQIQKCVINRDCSPTHGLFIQGNGNTFNGQINWWELPKKPNFLPKNQIILSGGTGKEIWTSDLDSVVNVTIARAFSVKSKTFYFSTTFQSLMTFKANDK